MEFKQNIKNLKKEYFHLIKKFFNNSNLLFKIIYEKQLADILYEGDLSFRTASLNKFSDKNISKIYKKDGKKAIELMRVRALACAEILDCMKKIFEYQDNMTDIQQNAIKEMYIVYNKIIDMAKDSIQLANSWAVNENINMFDIELQQVTNL